MVSKIQKSRNEVKSASARGGAPTPEKTEPQVTVGAADGWRIHSGTLACVPGVRAPASLTEVHVSAVVNMPDGRCIEHAVAIVPLPVSKDRPAAVRAFARRVRQSWDAREGYNALRPELVKDADEVMRVDLFAWKAIIERCAQVMKDIAAEVRP